MTTKLLPEDQPQEDLRQAFRAHLTGVPADAVDRLTRHDYRPRVRRVPVSVTAAAVLAASAAAAAFLYPSTVAAPPAASTAAGSAQTPAPAATRLGNDRIHLTGFATGQGQPRDYTFSVPPKVRAAIDACAAADGNRGDCFTLMAAAGPGAAAPAGAEKTTLANYSGWLGSWSGWTLTTPDEVKAAVLLPKQSGADEALIVTAKVVDGSPTAADLVEVLASGLGG